MLSYQSQYVKLDVQLTKYGMAINSTSEVTSYQQVAAVALAWKVIFFEL